MNHILTRSEYEALFPGQSYPKYTPEAVKELKARGLDTNLYSLDYLVTRGVVTIAPGRGCHREWGQAHIDRAARHLAEQQKFTPEAVRCSLENTSLAQDIAAFRKAREQAPLSSNDPRLFVRTVMPGDPARGVPAIVRYRPMSDAEAADWSLRVAFPSEDASA